MLPDKPKENECGILNLDDMGDNSPGNNGTHWTCWSKKGVNKFYFDSFGLRPPLEIIKYLGSADLSYNTFQFQSSRDVFCGHLCLYVLKELQNNTPEKVMAHLSNQDI